MKTKALLLSFALLALALPALSQTMPSGGGGNGSGVVNSFSAGTTGLSPSSPTTGAVVLGGTLVVANGGTNCTSASITCVGNITGASGTPGATTFLRGDNTWAVPAGTGTVTSISGGNGILPSTNPCTATCTLNTTVTLNAQTGTTYAMASTDGGKTVTASNASSQAYSIVQANTAGFTSGYGSTIANIGAGTVTLTAITSTFGNGLTSIVLAPGQVLDFASDGTNYPFSALSLPKMAADTVLGNFSGTANYPIASTLTDCHAVTNGLSYNTTTHAWGCNTSLALTNAANTFSGEQRNGITTLSISTATFTPDNSNNNYKIVLVHASCPCTIANPTTVTAGAAGVIEVDQSATGSDTVGTWGSDYIAAGGVAALTLSSGANAKDFFSYLVLDSTHILVTPAALNATH